VKTPSAERFHDLAGAARLRGRSGPPGCADDDGVFQAQLVAAKATANVTEDPAQHGANTINATRMIAAAPQPIISPLRRPRT